MADSLRFSYPSPILATSMVGDANHAPSPPLLLRLTWLTPTRCRALFVAILLVTFLNNLSYITSGPLDLSGDEAHYWDWSRQLDWSYYSKGPVVAYLIRASCAIFGDVAWAVRLPAVLLAGGTSILTYLLTRKLFGSDRLALGAVLLYGLAPLFSAGSVLMTIDPPFFFCWALATYLAVIAILDQKRWVWPLVGVVVGIGFLAKYAMLLWIFSLVLIHLLNRRYRSTHTQITNAPSPPRPTPESPDIFLGPRNILTVLAIALLFTTPVIIWNAQHDWVSIRHVFQQTGASGEKAFTLLNFPIFAAGQVGVLGPVLAVIIALAVVRAVRSRGARGAEQLLLAFGLPFLLMVTLVSVFAPVQLNWAAPAYFALLILAAKYLADALQDDRTWRRLRGWFWGTIILAIVSGPLVRDTSILYPWFPKLKWREIDPSIRLRGWKALGGHVSRELKVLGSGAFVLTDKYQTAGEMAFYVEGQPKTFYAGSYANDPGKRDRLSQYDVWPDRTLDPSRTTLLGRDCIFVGFMTNDMKAAFDRVEQLPEREIKVRGVGVRTMRLWRCFNFHGKARPPGRTKN